MGQDRLSGVLTVCSVLVSLLALPGLASAQQIGGTVTDTTGSVLPGVTVEARSPSIIEQVRTVVTDGSGQYLIVALEPGTYSVTYSLPGFATLIREGIQLTTGFTASIDVQLSVGDIEETVTVTGASPVVDIQNVEQQQVINRDVIDSIPTGKSFANYGLLIPGMSSTVSPLTAMTQDSAGMTGGLTLSRMSIHGGDGSDQLIEINGMDVSDGRTQGLTYTQFSDTSMEEISYSYSASPAEVESGGVRINMIPREGANEFGGQFFTTFTFPELHAGNVDQDLRDRGLQEGLFVDELWTFSPSFGGPIVRDRLWFFLSHWNDNAVNRPADVFLSDDVGSLFYAPGQTQSLDQTRTIEQSLNLTWNASPKDKIKAYWNNSDRHQPRALAGARGTSFFAPEAAIDLNAGNNTYQAAWTRPQTNRLLFEVGFTKAPGANDLGPAEGARTDLPGVIDVSGPFIHRNPSAWNNGSTHWNSPKDNDMFRASVSYVTGSHNLKFGAINYVLREYAVYRNPTASNWTRLIVLPPFGAIQAHFFTPQWLLNRGRSTGVYAQEQWTLNRLTVNAGIRYDYENSSYPDQFIPPTIWLPDGNVIEGQQGNGWHDLQPRLGVAYDLRGDGRTAVKVSLHRYGKRNGNDISGTLLNPANNNLASSRAWYDGGDPFRIGFPACIGPVECIAGDGIPQGDARNPVPNGELMSAQTNPAWGQPIITNSFDQDWAFGWGNRQANWELSASVQQELAQGLSLDVGYFRREDVNFFTTDNRSVSAEDYDEFELAIPTDPRLPGGGGGTISLYDIKPEAVAIPDRFVTSADNFGGRSRSWQGFDFTIDARLENLILQGGVSAGALSTDNCSLVSALPETQGGVATGLTTGGAIAVPNNFCDAAHDWLTQVKFLGSYTLPYDIQIAGTLQNQPGPVRLGQVTYTANQLAAALGRPHSVGSVRVDVIPPGTEYSDRFNQLDVRFTKILTLGGGTRLRAMFDIFNVFNENAVTQELSGFGPRYLKPALIMPGRLGKFSFQFDF